jgi:hypothetical protein
MTSGAITTWSVIEGQSYTAGEVLLGIETDKAVMDVEAMEDGIMGKILVRSFIASRAPLPFPSPISYCFGSNLCEGSLIEEEMVADKR